MSKGETMSDEMSTAKMTGDMIANMRSRIGMNLRIDESINNEYATRTAITRFVEGIGDDNPLWTDEEVAEASYLGRIVAPPSWVLCCFSGVQFGWPGLGAFHSSSHFTFHKAVRLGDHIVPRMEYLGFDGPRESKFAGKAVTDKFLQDYHNQNGELISEIRCGCVHYERGEGRKRSNRRAIELPHPWTKDELKDIEAKVLSERERGSNVRWWDDTSESEELDELTKGPIGLTDEIAFVASGAAPIPRLAAHAVALRRYKAKPNWAFRDPETSALEPIYAVHYNKFAAQAMGVQTAYDVGMQRSCWQIQLLTNWMGDDAWLKEAYGEYRGFVYLSDVVTFGGRVIERYVDEDNDHVVRVKTWAKNQRGDDVMPGEAVIALWNRGGTHPLEGK